MNRKTWRHYLSMSDQRLREETLEGLIEEGLIEEAFEYRRKWKL